MSRSSTVTWGYLALVLLAFVWLAMQVPVLYRLVSVDVSTDIAAEVNADSTGGAHVRLGKVELAAPQAALEHIQLALDPKNHWWLSNISHGKRVLHKRNAAENFRSVRSFQLMTGDVLVVGDERLSVQLLTAGELTLVTGGSRFVLSARAGWRDGVAIPACGFEQRAKHASRVWLHDLQPARVQLPGHWRLGGAGEHCFGKLGFPVLLPGQWRFDISDDGVKLLRTATVVEAQLPLYVERDGKQFSPDDMRVRLDHNDQLIVGRTHFRVHLEPGRLRLFAGDRTQRRLSPADSEPGAVWQRWVAEPWFGELMPAWQKMVFAPGLVLPLLLALLWRQRSYVRAFGVRARLRLGAAVASVALAAMVFVHVLPLPNFVLVPLALSVPAMCLSRGWRPSSMALLVVTALLYAVGLLSLWQLGAYSTEGHWGAYAHKMACFGIAGFSAILCCAELLGSGLIFRGDRRIGVARWRWVVRAMGAVAGLAIALQFALGVEAGVAGIQPVELVKLALVLWLAGVMASRLMMRGRERGIALYWVWAAVLWRFALLALVCTGALLWLRDFSPVVLLSSLLFGVFLAYYAAHPHAIVARRGVLVLVGITLVVLSLGYSVHQNPSYFSHVPQSDRFMVWGEPLLYPISGEQLSRALNVATDGGWFGNPTAINPSKVMSVPAIQDDFMPSFFRFRHGQFGSFLLLLIQAAFVTCWLGLGLRVVALVDARGTDDYRTREFGYFVAFCSVGGASVSLAHFLVSWGTNTGSLPVMGQPMPFLSAGGSHLLFFLLPLIAATIIATEEMEDA